MLSDGDDIEISDSEDESAAKLRKKRKIAVEEEEEEKENVDEVAPVVAAKGTEEDDEDRDEMSLTRANKELKGTEFADLAMTKVRLNFSSVLRYRPLTRVALPFRFSLPPISPRSTNFALPPQRNLPRTEAEEQPEESWQL